jgi:hypothetical protein
MKKKRNGATEVTHKFKEFIISIPLFFHYFTLFIFSFSKKDLRKKVEGNEILSSFLKMENKEN